MGFAMKCPGFKLSGAKSLGLRPVNRRNGALWLTNQAVFGRVVRTRAAWAATLLFFGFIWFWCPNSNSAPRLTVGDGVQAAEPSAGIHGVPLPVCLGVSNFRHSGERRVIYEAFAKNVGPCVVDGDRHGDAVWYDAVNGDLLSENEIIQNVSSASFAGRMDIEAGLLGPFRVHVFDYFFDRLGQIIDFGSPDKIDRWGLTAIGCSHFNEWHSVVADKINIATHQEWLY